MSIKVYRLDAIQNIEDTTHIGEKLRIYDTTDGAICTYILGCTIAGHAPIDIHTELIMHTDEGYEVAEATTYYDLDDKLVLAKANLNIYKKPHRGWNNRFLTNIWLCIFDDGRVEHGRM